MRRRERRRALHRLRIPYASARMSRRRARRGLFTWSSPTLERSRTRLHTVPRLASRRRGARRVSRDRVRGLGSRSARRIPSLVPGRGPGESSRSRTASRNTSAGEMPSSRFALDDDIVDLLKELDMAGVGGGGSARTSTTAPMTPAPCARGSSPGVARTRPSPRQHRDRGAGCGNDGRPPGGPRGRDGRRRRRRRACIIPPSFARVSDVTQRRRPPVEVAAVKCSLLR